MYVFAFAVLPDMDHWEDHFAHVKFDGDPTEDVHTLAGQSDAEKQRTAGMLGCWLPT